MIKYVTNNQSNRDFFGSLEVGCISRDFLYHDYVFYCNEIKAKKVSQSQYTDIRNAFNLGMDWYMNQTK